MWSDLRLGIRVLLKSRGFYVVSVLTLALAIGANTALFSLVDGIVIRPLPFPHPTELTSLPLPLPKGILAIFQRQEKSLDAAGYLESETNLIRAGQATRVHVTSVSPNFFTVLGVTPVIGRSFQDGDDQPGHDGIALLSDWFWRQNFGSDARVIGKMIQLGDFKRIIVGIMSPGFSFPSRETAFWLPLDMEAGNFGDYWGSSAMPVIGRLRPGVSLNQARAELRTLIPELRFSFPFGMPSSWGATATLTSLQLELAGRTRTLLLILFGAAGLVLLMACVNLVSFLLARSAVRKPEFAIRAALGATRRRIARQLLMENGVLAISGGAAGTVFALTTVPFIRAFLPADIPGIENVSLNVPVLGFALAITLLCGAVFGVAPAMVLSERSLAAVLKSGGAHASDRGTHRVHRLLVSSEIAITTVLAVATGLLAHTMRNLSQIDLGFSAEHLVTAKITPNASFCLISGPCENFYRDLLQEAASLPGVRGVAAASKLPLDDAGLSAFPVSVQGYIPPSRVHPGIWQKAVTPGYLAIMGIPLKQGRDFTAGDSSVGAPPVALVTSSTASHFWPGQNPLGKTIGPFWEPSSNQYRIVGVVADVHEFRLTQAIPKWVEGEVYVPYGSNDVRLDGTRGDIPEMTLILKVEKDGLPIADELAGLIARLNHAIPPPQDVKTMDVVVSGAEEATRTATWLFAAFVLFALILGATGVYGLVSYFVTRKTREIGIRIALGANGRDVSGFVMNRVSILILIGLVAGLAATAILARVLRSFLIGVSPADPITFVAVSLLIAVVSLCACYFPICRAVRIDPISVLRNE